MTEEMKRLIFKAKSLNGGRSLADNKVVKESELDAIEKGLIREVSNLQLSQEQESELEEIRNSLRRLKGLSGNQFRSGCSGVGYKIEKFFQSVCGS